MAGTIVLLILACLAAVYLGYPLLILALAAGRRVPPPPAGGAPPASVSIIVCAHNEAASIGAKLRSVGAAVARRADAEILVVDDGSTDATAQIVAELAQAVPLRLMRLPRGGKAAALRQAIAVARGEILVFSDADPLWEAGTLDALLAPFADPGVGAVAGEVRSLRASAASRWRAGDALFRAYESAIRAAEDRLFGCVSADGGLFALRAALAEPVPPDVTDDFYLSTAAVARGYRIAFRPDAAVYEVSPPGARQHLRRRIRITVRGLTGLWRRRQLLNPLRTGAYAVALLFHKLLRRLAPLLLLPLWVALLWLADEAGGVAAAALFLGATVSALLLLVLPLPLPKWVRLPLYVAVHLFGLAAGTLLFLAGRRYTQWAPQKP
jgi:cellulose synthase/poly-beta-1,6-N-acetylglucosamine synthase-like glycosyltransferase